ncbi:hypothetical protein F444_20667 [Phytophthora nicotianae P1976]|uniref:RxLR effector protein n=1 Tax=Phytophthora nicotianae P1976 TaxID=1317066 RepID=A0A080Z3Y0_PHYNI|nr:hypothetical protein F444_20667 [Phytophthora nicotianae P1976]
MHQYNFLFASVVAVVLVFIAGANANSFSPASVDVVQAEAAKQNSFLRAIHTTEGNDKHDDDEERLLSYIAQFIPGTATRQFKKETDNILASLEKLTLDMMYSKMMSETNFRNQMFAEWRKEKKSYRKITKRLKAQGRTDVHYTNLASQFRSYLESVGDKKLAGVKKLRKVDRVE